jgi:hypothetical protein
MVLVNRSLALDEARKDELNMTLEQRDNDRLVNAARAAALALPKDSPGRQAIFNLAFAFQDLARDHNLCILRPTVTSLAEVKASCSCPVKLDGTTLCHMHAIDRHVYLGNKIGRLSLEAADLKPEHDELARAIQIARDGIKVTRAPVPAPSRTAKPLDPRIADVLAKINAL